MEVTSVLDGIQKVGLPVMGVIALAFGMWKLGIRALDKAEARLDAKEAECAKEREAHAAERKEHSTAHLAAISALTGELRQTNASLGTLGEHVRDLRRAV